MIEVEGKKVSVIGAARSGIGAGKLIKKLGGVPFVSDFGSKEKLRFFSSSSSIIAHSKPSPNPLKKIFTASN